MVTPSDKDDIISCLKNFDCCPRCILRFLKIKASTDVYLNPEIYLNENEATEDLPAKKIKRNPCRVCLDILQESTIKRFVEQVKHTNYKEYQHDDFTTRIFVPKAVTVRNHSMCLYLKEKFPTFYSNLDDMDSVNKAFKMSTADFVPQVISKMFKQHSNFVLSFDVDYEDDELEVQNIKKLNPKIKKGEHGISKNAIIDILSKCDDALFKRHFNVPPSIPNKQTTVKVFCSAEPMWIGGRYLKFSREMGQTPWVINNKALTQYNLQDIIFDSVVKILGCDKEKLTFCSSGREDSDVRMLGNGRPFYVQIDDPKLQHLTFEQFRAIEHEIFQSKLAAVIKLQNVTKSDLTKIKDGEQNKRKHYHALCQTNALDIDHVVNVINEYKNGGLEIAQKTPLRVLHRRTQAVRKKYIYSMEAKKVEDDPRLIEVRLVTQAGTYVKEFVNGDFQRTEPSLCSIIGDPIDIVALDVTSIELEWPEE